MTIEIAQITQNSRCAYQNLNLAAAEARAACIRGAANNLRKRTSEIIAANHLDVAIANEANQSAAFIDRLMLDEKRINGIAEALEEIANFADPLGKVLTEWVRPNGLRIQKISVPLGVIGVIYESRPNVTADAAALCIKSGNAVILRPGSESYRTSEVIADCIRQALRTENLDENAVQIMPTTDRAGVTAMITATGLIDVIIPRGGKGLTRKIMEESRVPTILHLDGNCHTYIHKSADVDMAIKVCVNAKMRRTGVCGATESILIDADILAQIAPQLLSQLQQRACEIRGDEHICKLFPDIIAATEEDWQTEYLEKIVSIKTVSDVSQAIQHINHYGSHHTDAIIANDTNAVSAFMAGVDSAIVMHNTSTQFADGGEFGLGGEIGISTGRLHARGPVGAEQLTTYKYLLFGDGQVRP
jgi:glutamate-5-semialdehyde dehydrogenase